MLNIEENKPLFAYTTFNIGGLASYFVEIKDEYEAKEVVTWAKHKELDILIIGKGSNMLLPDIGFSGLAIKNSIKGIKEEKLNDGSIILEAGAGEDWNDLVKYSLDKNYWGLENLYYIPGSVGAAPVQNIGAYGVELKDVFYSLSAIDLKTLEKKIFKPYECDFSYRSSIFKKQFKDRYLITSVKFKLSLDSRPKLDYGSLRGDIDKDVYDLKPEDVANAIKKVRQSKLPNPEEWGNSGSFFQNPEISLEDFKVLKDKFPDIKYYELGGGMIKVPAGWLIEKSGWKGRSLGPAGVWEKQALIIINLGGAKAKDILKLANTISKDVKEKFNIDLVPEVNIYE